MRRFTQVLGVALIAALLGGCSFGCRTPVDVLPKRVTWPHLAPYPGATTLQSQTSPTAPGDQELRFVTFSMPGEVINFYRDSLMPQGFHVGYNGGLEATDACPALYLTIEQLPDPNDDRHWVYRLTLSQAACRDYC